MNRLLSLCFLLLCCVQIHAERQADFFVRVLPDRETLFAGDSMLVSVVLYSVHPIAQAECSGKFKVKGDKCSVRPLHIRRDETAGRVREGNRLFYTLVWEQYVVAPGSSGSYSLPSLKFKADVQEIISMPDIFDHMMGTPPEYRMHKVEAASEPFTFKVKEKPLRSTREMMRSTTVI